MCLKFLSSKNLREVTKEGRHSPLLVDEGRVCNGREQHSSSPSRAASTLCRSRGVLDVVKPAACVFPIYSHPRHLRDVKCSVQVS